MPNNTSTSQTTIKVLYFASLAQQAQCHEEYISVESRQLSDIYEYLKTKYHFDLSQDRLAVAANHQMVDWQYQVQPNDIIVFIPPVAGG